MNRADVRAVDNPISAIFDLADDVNKEVPRIRKLVKYATVFIGVWLIIDFILTFLLIFNQFLLGVLMLALFVVGVFALAMLRNLNDFIRYYAIRHAAILRVRNDDPVVFAPKGDTAVLRLFEFLRIKNPTMNEAIAERRYLVPGILRGRTGVLYSFEGYLASKPSAFWALFGWGYPGYQLMIKSFQNAPRAEDLNSLKLAAEDVSKDNLMPPSRVIAMWTRKADQDLSDDAYAFLTSNQVLFSHRGKRYATALELIIENEDGSYEFIPYVG
jgi:hypothetical protein